MLVSGISLLGDDIFLCYNVIMNIANINQGTGLKGRFKIKAYRAGTNDLVYESVWHKNLLSSADGHGLNIMLRLLNNDNTYSLGITHAKIGTDNTAASESQTDLLSPVNYNIIVANRTISDTKTLLLEFFLPDTFIPDDTYSEFGTFAGDQMISRAVIVGDYVKASNTDTRIEYEFSFSNV